MKYSIGAGFDINTVDEKFSAAADIINIENPLYTNFFNTDYRADIRAFLGKAYGKRIIVDGAYIDINPAAREKEIAAVVAKLVGRSIRFAEEIGAEEIIFLSTFLPMIGLEFYDEGFIQGSAEFWARCASETKIRISLCNLFEYTPDVLLEINRRVGAENFGLAFDAGHALAYSKIPLDEFARHIMPYSKTVYLHSNHGVTDEHLNLTKGALLSDEGFRRALPLFEGKNLLLKPFDKFGLSESLSALEKLFPR